MDLEVDLLQLLLHLLFLKVIIYYLFPLFNLKTIIVANDANQDPADVALMSQDVDKAFAESKACEAPAVVSSIPPMLGAPPPIDTSKLLNFYQMCSALVRIAAHKYGKRTGISNSLSFWTELVFERIRKAVDSQKREDHEVMALLEVLFQDPATSTLITSVTPKLQVFFFPF